MAKQGGIINQVKTITKSFTTPLPEGEKWYEDRLAICNACELNTKNIDFENLSLKDKIQKQTVSKAICDSGNHCTACSCCIERKCATRTETCGLEKLGQTPKWSALETGLLSDASVSIVNLEPEKGTVVQSNKSFDFDLGTVEDETVSISFIVKRKGGLDLKDFSAGCSCTIPEYKVLDKESVQFTISINTSKFKPGVASNKTFNVNYYNKPKQFKTIIVNFKIKKK